MNIEIGMILKIKLLKYADGTPNVEQKKRFMLVIDKQEFNSTLVLLNISSVLNKPEALTYKCNYLLNEHSPLPVPSFVKMDGLYTISSLENLDNFVCFNGMKINDHDLNCILKKYSNIKFSSTVKRSILNMEDILSSV